MCLYFQWFARNQECEWLLSLFQALFLALDTTQHARNSFPNCAGDKRTPTEKHVTQCHLDQLLDTVSSTVLVHMTLPAFGNYVPVGSCTSRRIVAFLFMFPEPALALVVIDISSPNLV